MQGQQGGMPLQQRAQRSLALRQLMPSRVSSCGPPSGLHSHLLHYSPSMPPPRRAETIADNGHDDDGDSDGSGGSGGDGRTTDPSDADNNSVAAAAVTADNNIPSSRSQRRRRGALLLASIGACGGQGQQTGSAETEGEPDVTRYPTSHLQPTFTTTGSSTGNTLTTDPTTGGTATQLNTAFSSALAAAQAATSNASLPGTMSGAAAAGGGAPGGVARLLLRSCATLDNAQINVTGMSPPAPAQCCMPHALAAPPAAATAGGMSSITAAAAGHAMARRAGSFLAPGAAMLAPAGGLLMPQQQPHRNTENGGGAGAAAAAAAAGRAGAGGGGGGAGVAHSSLLLLRGGSSAMARYLVGDLSPPRHVSAGGGTAAAATPVKSSSPRAAGAVEVVGVTARAEESSYVRRRNTAARLVTTPPSPARLTSPAAPLLEDVERVLSRADEWCFDTWALDEVTQGHALSALGFFLLQREGLISTLGLKPFTVARLLRTIESGYQPNPYHSATHAADVLQTLHVIIHGAGLHVHYLDKLGLTAAYFAAIVHDHRHPGMTNDFLIATGDTLALRYNDRSPLENHHVASAFELMTRPELNLLAPLAAADRAAFRKLVIEMVLATDMKQHFAILSHFNTVHSLASYAAKQPDAAPVKPTPMPPQQQPLQQAGGAHPRPQPSNGHTQPAAAITVAVTRSPPVAVDAAGSSAAAAHAASPHSTALTQGGAGHEVTSAPRPRDEAERVLSLQVALKVADVGHLGESLPVHQRWLGGLEEEFFRQGDKEKAMGIPISPLFDRMKKGVSKGQVGFYDFVGNPLVFALASAFPGAKPLEAAFHDNYSHWKQVEAKQSAL